MDHSNDVTEHRKLKGRDKMRCSYRPRSEPDFPMLRSVSDKQLLIYNVNYRQYDREGIRLFLVRHGESMGNVDSRVYRHWADHTIPLSPLGEEQAQKAGSNIRNFYNDHWGILKEEEKGKDEKEKKDEKKHHKHTTKKPVYGSHVRMLTSPYKRTRETAENILKTLGDYVTDLKESIYLGEQQFGLFEGLEPNDIENNFPREYALFAKSIEYGGRYWARPPLGESRFDVCARVSRVIDEIMYDSEHLGINDFIIVSHGVTIRAFIMMWLERSPEWFENSRNPNNCEVFHIYENEEQPPLFPGFPPEEKKPLPPPSISSTKEDTLSSSTNVSSFLDTTSLSSTSSNTSSEFDSFSSEERDEEEEEKEEGNVQEDNNNNNKKEKTYSLDDLALIIDSMKQEILNLREEADNLRMELQTQKRMFVPSPSSIITEEEERRGILSPHIKSYDDDDNGEIYVNKSTKEGGTLTKSSPSSIVRKTTNYKNIIPSTSFSPSKGILSSSSSPRRKSTPSLSPSLHSSKGVLSSPTKVIITSKHGHNHNVSMSPHLRSKEQESPISITFRGALCTSVPTNTWTIVAHKSITLLYTSTVTITTHGSVFIPSLLHPSNKKNKIEDTIHPLKEMENEIEDEMEEYTTHPLFQATIVIDGELFSSEMNNISFVSEEEEEKEKEGQNLKGVYYGSGVTSNVGGWTSITSVASVVLDSGEHNIELQCMLYNCGRISDDIIAKLNNPFGTITIIPRSSPLQQSHSNHHLHHNSKVKKQHINNQDTRKTVCDYMTFVGLGSS